MLKVLLCKYVKCAVILKRFGSSFICNLNRAITPDKNEFGIESISSQITIIFICQRTEESLKVSIMPTLSPPATHKGQSSWFNRVVRTRSVSEVVIFSRDPLSRLVGTKVVP